ncbi:MAG: hypothetical protein ACYTGS_19855 [Planctomycetota bacterium]|jgi:hypothetical protein
MRYKALDDLGLPTIVVWVVVITLIPKQGWCAAASVGEVLSEDYEVRAAGQKVDVYTARVLDPPFAGKQWDYGGAYSLVGLRRRVFVHQLRHVRPC